MQKCSSQPLFWHPGVPKQCHIPAWNSQCCTCNGAQGLEHKVTIVCVVTSLVLPVPINRLCINSHNQGDRLLTPFGLWPVRQLCLSCAPWLSLSLCEGLPERTACCCKSEVCQIKEM